MNRIFGTSTAKKPKATLQDAINSVGRSPVQFQDTIADRTVTQTDARIASIEVNVKKLDGELMRYKEQMSKLRNGPGKVTCPTAHTLFSMLTSMSADAESDRTTCPSRPSTKEDVRRPTRPTGTTDVQHAVRRDRYGEPKKHDGDRGGDEACEQGNKEAVWED